MIVLNSLSENTHKIATKKQTTKIRRDNEDDDGDNITNTLVRTIMITVGGDVDDDDM